MGGYIIGSGAILTSGESAAITRASLHAQVRETSDEADEAIAVAFDGCGPQALRRLLILGRGWSAAAFERSVTAELLRRGTCSLPDVLAVLAISVGTATVHLFANWEADGWTRRQLNDVGIELICHPLTEIEQAALISEQRCTRWSAGASAA